MRGSYTCVCQAGFYFPDTQASVKSFSGKVLEAFFEPAADDTNGSQPVASSAAGGGEQFRCVRCADGCESCVDDTPCLYAKSTLLGGTLMGLTCTLIVLVGLASFTVHYYRKKKVRRSQ